MEAGVDILWPIEHASEIRPQGLGRDLLLRGGVDKRIIARGPNATRAHLCKFIPLIEEGGFIPTVDHAVPPDISWDDLRYYMDTKAALLTGDFAALE